MPGVGTDVKLRIQPGIEDKSATKDERTVAQAAADKPKLEAIVKSDKASSSVKTLAEIILKLSHMPSERDKEKLKALASWCGGRLRFG